MTPRSETPILDYAPAPPRFSRRLRRWAIVLSILAILGGTLWQHWSKLNVLTVSLRRQTLLRQCPQYSPPVNSVVFDESAVEAVVAQEDLSQFGFPPPPAPQYYHTRTGRPTTQPMLPTYSAEPRQPPQPKPLSDLKSIDWQIEVGKIDGRVKCINQLKDFVLWNGTPPRPLVMLQELKTPKGESRLMELRFMGGDFVRQKPPYFWGRTFDTTFSLRDLEIRYGCWGWHLEDFDLPPDQPLKLYAGQPDPNDRTHFTIRYEAAGQEGIIDGWLKDDDTVRLVVRDGPGKGTAK